MRGEVAVHPTDFHELNLRITDRGLALVLGDPARGKTTTLLSFGFECLRTGWRVFYAGLDSSGFEDCTKAILSSNRLRQKSLFLLDDCHRAPLTAVRLTEEFFSQARGNAHVLLASRRVDYPPADEGDFLVWLRTKGCIFQTRPSKEQIRFILSTSLGIQPGEVEQEMLESLTARTGDNLRILGYYLRNWDPAKESIDKVSDDQVIKHLAAEYGLNDPSARAPLLRAAGVYSWDIPVNEEFIAESVSSLRSHGLLSNRGGYYYLAHSVDAEWLLRAAEQLRLLGVSASEFSQQTLLEYAATAPPNLPQVLLAAHRRSPELLLAIVNTTSAETLRKWQTTCRLDDILQMVQILKDTTAVLAPRDWINADVLWSRARDTPERVRILDRIARLSPMTADFIWQNWSRNILPVLPVDTTIKSLTLLGRALKKIGPSHGRHLEGFLASPSGAAAVSTICMTTPLNELAEFLTPGAGFRRSTVLRAWDILRNSEDLFDRVEGTVGDDPALFVRLFSTFCLLDRSYGRRLWARTKGQVALSMTNRQKGMVFRWVCRFSRLEKDIRLEAWDLLKLEAVDPRDFYQSTAGVSEFVAGLLSVEGDVLRLGNWVAPLGKWPGASVKALIVGLNSRHKVQLVRLLISLGQRDAVYRAVRYMTPSDLQQLLDDTARYVSFEESEALNAALSAAPARHLWRFGKEGLEARYVQFSDLIASGEEQEALALLPECPNDSTLWSGLLRIEGAPRTPLVHEIGKRGLGKFSYWDLNRLVFALISTISMDDTKRIVLGVENESWLRILRRISEQNLALLLINLTMVTPELARSLIIGLELSDRLSKMKNPLARGALLGLAQYHGSSAGGTDSRSACEAVAMNAGEYTEVMQLGFCLLACPASPEIVGQIESQLESLLAGSHLPPAGLELLMRVRTLYRALIGNTPELEVQS